MRLASLSRGPGGNVALPILAMVLLGPLATACSPVGFIIGGAAALSQSGNGRGGAGSVNTAPTVSIDPPVRLTASVQVDYRLADAEGNPADVAIEYDIVPYPGTGSPTGNWSICTEAGGDGLTGLATSAGGTPHQFVWDAALDLLGAGTAEFVRIRITPRDTADGNLIGIIEETATFKAANDAPTVTVTTPSGIQRGLVQIDYSLGDSTDDPVDIQVDFSEDGGSNWSPAANIPVGETAGLTSSRLGESHNFAWDSDAEGVVNSSAVRIRITPCDRPDGTTPVCGSPVGTTDFVVENNTPPIVFISSPVSGQVIGGDLDINYLLLDANSEPLSIVVEYSTDAGVTFSTATEGAPSDGTTGLTSDPDGIPHVFRWASQTDLPDRDIPPTQTDPALQILITAMDAFGSTPSLPTTGLLLDNNTEPGVSVSTPASPQVLRDVTIDYALADGSADLADIDVEYSTDGGQQWQTAVEQPGPPSEGTMNLATSVAGTSHTFVWDTMVGLAGILAPNVVVRIRARDNPDPALGEGLPAFTDIFTVDNTSPPGVVIPNIPGPIGGTALLDYTLFDQEGNPVDLDVSFSSSGSGGPFTPATRDPAQGDGITGLTSSLGGQPHTFAWDSLADLGPARETNVVIRMIPSDTKTGLSASSNVFTADNNDAPITVVNTPVGGQSGNVAITYTLFDTNGDPCSAIVEWSTDGGTTYSPGPATEGTGSDGTSGLSSSPTGVGHLFIWDSVQDIGLISAGNVRVRIAASDSLAGTAAETGIFSVDNGTLVPVVIIDPLARSYGSDVSVTYRLLDANASLADVTVSYSTDGVTFSPVTNIKSTDQGTPSGSTITGQSTSPGGVAHDLVWESALDIGPGVVQGAYLRILPSDVDGTGVEDTSNPFIVGNDAPTATITDPVGGGESGLVLVAFDLVDSTSDGIDVTPEYSTDGGALFAPASIQVGGTTGLASSPGGVAHSFAWNSVADLGIGNFTAVRFRITPTDDEPLAGTPDVAVFDVQNNDLPVAFIGAPAAGDLRGGDVSVSYILIDGNADAIDITVEYSTDGATYLPAAERVSPPSEGTTGLSSSPGGDGHVFVWDSAADLPSVDSDTVTIRLTPSDQEMGVAFTTPDFLVNNNTEPSSAVSTPTGRQEGDVSIDYVIFDVEGDPVDIDVLYSLDGISFLAATESTSGGSEGTTGLSSSSGGVGHVFIWDTGPTGDGIAAFAPEGTVTFQIAPRDHPNLALGEGTRAQTAFFTVDNTTPPTVTITDPASPQSGDIIILYTLFDDESSPQEIVVEYSTDGISYFAASECIAACAPGAPLSDGTLALPSSPGGVPHVYRWAAGADLGPALVTNVTVRITPTDSKAGPPAVSSAFVVDNNEAPGVEILSIVGVRSGEVTISYKLRDSASDPCGITVKFSAGGSPFAPATEGTGGEGTGGLTSGPLGQEVAHDFSWDSMADLSTTYFTDVQIRITPADASLTGPADVSNTFTVDNAILADLVLGKDYLEEGEVDGRGLGSATGAGMEWQVGLNVLLVCDPGNHRVLEYWFMPQFDFQTANAVYGQPDLISNSSNYQGPSATSLHTPTAVHRYRNNVCDTGNNRVLWGGSGGGHVLGQPDLVSNLPNRGGPPGPETMSAPRGISATSSELYVSDTGNNRILVWTLPIDFSGGEGPPADMVLGQATFFDALPNRGGVMASADTLWEPQGLFADEATGLLSCADSLNHRVLQWQVPIGSNNTTADTVLGQYDFVDNYPNVYGRDKTSLDYPLGVYVDATNTYVADTGNHRVSIWSTTTPASSSPANFVLGQPTGSEGTPNNGGISSTSLYAPSSTLSIGGKLLVYDQGNHRVKIHDPIPASDNAPAQVVIGQVDFTEGTPNHRGRVFAHTFLTPAGVDTDGWEFYLADRGNHRVLGWTTGSWTNNMGPDLVFGQTSFIDNAPATSAGGLRSPSDVSFDSALSQLWVVDRGNNRVLRYDAPFSIGDPATVCIGQVDLVSSGASTSQNGLRSPSAVDVFDSLSDVWVADEGNHRILRFPWPHSTGMAADLVIGQADFSSGGPNHSGAGDPEGDQSLEDPAELYVQHGAFEMLAVADTGNHRVLIWPTLPTADDEPAGVVVGQPDFSINGLPGIGRAGLNSPTGIQYDPTNPRVFVVVDAGNNRVLIWDSLPTVNGAPADRILGQPNFQSASGNFVGGGVSARGLFIGTAANSSPVYDVNRLQLWVPDQGNNRVLRFDISPW